MTNRKSFLDALQGQKTRSVPFWFMRQAGRYLPEYRAVRKEAGSFLDLAYNPDFAAEVTLQPLRRFGMSAAIIFSDILVVPHALSRSLDFVEGEGPKLDPLNPGDSLPVLLPESFDATLSPVYSALSRTREKMDEEGFSDAALIGFAGAPWTVACYMVEGRGSRDFVNVKRWAYQDPGSFGALMDVLVTATVRYLSAQIEAGAEAIQIFDSWAGVLDEEAFRSRCVTPVRSIVQGLKSLYPDVPVIGFPRGAGLMYRTYARDTGCDAVSLDPQIPVNWARDVFHPEGTAVQGNLDPLRLLTGGDSMIRAAENILSALSDKPFVFNLGHGIHKDTPPEHVEQLSNFIREWCQ